MVGIDNNKLIGKVSSSIQFIKSQITIRKYGKYSTIELDNGIPKGFPGQPALPWRKFYLSIPWDAVPGDLALNNVKTAVIAEDIIVEPLQPNVPALMPADGKWVPLDPGLCASDAAYPSIFARITSTRRLGGFLTAELQVCPFRYYGRSRILEMVESFDLDLSYTQTGKKLMKPSSVMALRHERMLENRVKSMVLNPDHIELDRPFEGGALFDFNVPPTIDYVIVTTKSLSREFKRLANWRARLGLRSKVVTLEDIKANDVEETEDANGKRAIFWHEKGYHDGGTRDTAEAIRNFTKWAEENWHTQYILLGGDTEVIPCRQGIHTGNIYRWRLKDNAAWSYWDKSLPDIDVPFWDEKIVPHVFYPSEASGNDSTYISLEFDEALHISYLLLRWDADYAKSYEIQISKDKLAWTTIYSTMNGLGGKERVKLPCPYSKYLRLKINDTNSFSLQQVSAIKAYSGTDYNNNFPGTNQLGIFYHASSNSSSAEKLLKNENASWTPKLQDKNPHIQLKVQPKSIINCIRLKWSSTKVPTYVLKASQNGSDFKPIDLEASKSSMIEERTFEWISFPNGGYLRLEIAGGFNFSLESIGLYGPPCVPWGGVIYRIDPTTSRIYLHENGLIKPEKDDQIFILQTGIIIPYNSDASDTNLGWYYIKDLVNGEKSDTSTRFVEIKGPSDYHGQQNEDLRPHLVFKTDDNYIPADLYYSDFAEQDGSHQGSHDWDIDKNGIYGVETYLVHSKDAEQWGEYPEHLDTAIAYADVFLGRAPVNNLCEARTFVDKVICYERFEDQEGYSLPSDFAISVLLGSANWSATGAGDWGMHLDRSAVESEKIRRMLLDYASYWKLIRLYQDYTDVPEQDNGPDLAGANHDSIINALGKGNNIVSLISHGGSDGCCFIYSCDASGLENIPGVFFGCACYTGRFDWRDNKSFAEELILNPYGGAVGYVGASRMGSTGDGPINQAFWRRLIDKSTSCRLGDMFNACKEVEPCGGGWQTYTWNLLGDPAMRVWSDQPKRLKVTYSQKICTGNQTFEVSVDSKGPVKDAEICLTMDGSLFASVITDASGKASVTITPIKAGILHLSVSGKNMIPFTDSVYVEKCPTACSSKVICNNILICKKELTCKTTLSCLQMIHCKNQLIATCYPMLMACRGCPAVNPLDINWQDLVKNWTDLATNPSYIEAIWGIRDVKEFVRLADRPEIKNSLEELPIEIRKPIKMMVKRMKKEMNLE